MNIPIILLIAACTIVVLGGGLFAVLLERGNRKIETQLRKDFERFEQQERESQQRHDTHMLILGALSLNKAGLLRPGDMSKMLAHYDLRVSKTPPAVDDELD